MVKLRRKGKGRKTTGTFLALPTVVMNNQDFRILSGSGLKTLVMVAAQYNGFNNGDLSAPFSRAKDWGIRSQQTLSKSLKELIERRLLVRTREGRFMNPGRKCALYALTWHPVDECSGKLDVFPTLTPPRSFSLEGKIKLPSP